MLIKLLRTSLVQSRCPARNGSLAPAQNVMKGLLNKNRLPIAGQVAGRGGSDFSRRKYCELPPAPVPSMKVGGGSPAANSARNAMPSFRAHELAASRRLLRLVRRGPPGLAKRLAESTKEDADPAVALDKGGRPKAGAPKVHIGFRLAADVVASLKASGPGYNVRVEEALAQRGSARRRKREGHERRQAPIRALPKAREAQPPICA